MAKMHKEAVKKATIFLLLVSNIYLDSPKGDLGMSIKSTWGALAHVGGTLLWGMLTKGCILIEVALIFQNVLRYQAIQL